MVGGATGVEFAYVELALLDLPQALNTIREVARERRFPPTSWVLFHDDTLAEEWFGLGDDGPLPPGRG